MKKIAMWLSVMALGLCIGCAEPEPVIRVNLKFEKGQVVDLKIGGHGQIIKVNPQNGKPYQVRIRTDNGWLDHWMEEFELEISPWEPS